MKVTAFTAEIRSSVILFRRQWYRYLFTTIDVFTKMAWVYPIKANTCQNIMDSFKDILERCGKKPKRLNTDR